MNCEKFTCVIAGDLGHTYFLIDNKNVVENIRGAKSAAKKEEDMLYTWKLIAPFEKGKISTKEFYERLVKRFPHFKQYAFPEDFELFWYKIFKFRKNDALIDMSLEIKNEYPDFDFVFMPCSNLAPSHFNSLTKEFSSDLFCGKEGFFNYLCERQYRFHAFSFEFGVIKQAKGAHPGWTKDDPRFFQEAVKCAAEPFGKKPDAVIYLDDIQGLIKVANSRKKLGINGIWYQSPDQRGGKTNIKDVKKQIRDILDKIR